LSVVFNLGNQLIKARRDESLNESDQQQVISGIKEAMKEAKQKYARLEALPSLFKESRYPSYCDYDDFLYSLDYESC
jgi:hypothetical protein